MINIIIINIISQKGKVWPYLMDGYNVTWWNNNNNNLSRCKLNANVWEIEGIAPRILNLQTRWKWVVSRPNSFTLEERILIPTG
jgi:hypothetical protein